MKPWFSELKVRLAKFILHQICKDIMMHDEMARTFAKMYAIYETSLYFFLNGFLSSSLNFCFAILFVLCISYFQQWFTNILFPYPPTSVSFFLVYL